MCPTSFESESKLLLLSSASKRRTEPGVGLREVALATTAKRGGQRVEVQVRRDAERRVAFAKHSHLLHRQVERSHRVLLRTKGGGGLETAGQPSGTERYGVRDEQSAGDCENEDQQRNPCLLADA